MPLVPVPAGVWCPMTTAWRLAPQESDPVDGAFIDVFTITFTRTALELFGEDELLAALAALVNAAVTRKLDAFQVLERVVGGVADGEVLYATDRVGHLTLMTPGDW